MLNKRKILIYQKNESRPISLTDESESTDNEIKLILTKCFTSENITTLEIGKDTIIMRPTEISSIAIFPILPIQNSTVKNIGTNENKDDKYDDELSLETSDTETTKDEK